MYNLPDYKEDDINAVREFMHKNPFAFVTGCGSDMIPVATQLPVFPEEDNGRLVLRGHLMKNTDHHKAFIDNPNVLVVFTGAHTYVSATWYTNPHQGSTWNYISVHAKGKIKFLDEKALADVLQKTSLHFENGKHDSATVFKNLPEEYTTRLMKAIVAFEIEVHSLDNVFKLSQNRDKQSYEHITDKLKESGGNAAIIAEEMEKRTEKLFPQAD